MKTANDLYKAVVTLCKRHSQSCLSLEEFLIELLHHASKQKHLNSLSFKQVYELLSSSFLVRPTHVAQEDSAKETDPFFSVWESKIQKQIHSLAQMKENGTFENKYRYYGTKSPDGEDWYNFDPRSYIECAAAGLRDTRKKSDSKLATGCLTWSEFELFLTLGQIYE